jgi:hypothetical protein
MSGTHPVTFIGGPLDGETATTSLPTIEAAHSDDNGLHIATYHVEGDIALYVGSRPSLP